MLKKGDKVRCVESFGVSLTIGKDYVLTYVNTGNDPYYGLYDDNDFYSIYPAYMFITILEFRNIIIDEILD